MRYWLWRSPLETRGDQVCQPQAPLPGQQNGELLLGEIGGVWVNLPDKDVLRYDGPGTFTAGSTSASACG